MWNTTHVHKNTNSMLHTIYDNEECRGRSVSEKLGHI